MKVGTLNIVTIVTATPHPVFGMESKTCAYLHQRVSGTSFQPQRAYQELPHLTVRNNIKEYQNIKGVNMI